MIVLTMVLLLSFGITGCSNVDEQYIDEKNCIDKVLQCNNIALVSKDSLPLWIQEKIDYTISNPKKFPYISIYEGEIGYDVIYFIHNPISSCFFCTIYDKYGKELSDVNPYYIYKDTTWKLIYSTISK